MTKLRFRAAQPAFPACLSIFFLMLLAAFTTTGAQAKDLEPRSYTNTPVGLNFLIAGHVYADGKLAFDPSSKITDAKYRSNTEVLAYAHSLDAWGKSAKFDVIVPYTSFSGHASVGTQTREREMSGFNDPKFRFSMNFHGAPALSLKEFANYRQDLVIGASLQVSPPMGQYDNTKLVNLGANRWSFKSELGVSKTIGALTMEIMPSVTFYTDNTDFNRGRTFEQAPLYALQGHLIYGFANGVWVAANATYFTGERTTVDGVQSDNQQTNSRVGLTLALPVDKYNSLKFYASTGTSTRTGSDFDLLGVAWQYRWGGGF
jgi:hypothetical protein